MEEPGFIINTVMSKEDYRKFLYIATFKRNKWTIPMIALIALLGSMMVSLGGPFNYLEFILYWILFFALAIIAVILKIERKNAQRIKTDKTGSFGSVNTLKFYDDKIVIENEALKSKGELRYDQFFMVMESKDYFIFYLTANQASFIRKKDLENPDAFRKFIVGKFQGKYKNI